MTTRLPDPQQPTANPAGQPTPDHDPRKTAAQNFLADLESSFTNTPAPDRVPTTTRFHDPRPAPTIGTTLPVPQPGRPPMSQKAVDASTIMLSAGVASMPVGAGAIGIMLASGHADPTVIGLICAAPVGLAVPILAVSWLVKRVKEVAEAAPAEHHHHYTGTVVQDHRTTTTHTRGVWANTRNELPR